MNVVCVQERGRKNDEVDRRRKRKYGQKSERERRKLMR